MFLTVFEATSHLQQREGTKEKRFFGGDWTGVQQTLSSQLSLLNLQNFSSFSSYLKGIYFILKGKLRFKGKTWKWILCLMILPFFCHFCSKKAEKKGADRAFKGWTWRINTGKLIYLTNKSLSVAHNDDVSHVSPLESSSSVLLNQLVFVDVFFNRADSFEDPLLDDDDDELLLPPLKNPSMALPMIRASTIALRPSHFKRFNGDLCSFRFFGLGFSFELDAEAVGASLVSVNFSNVSFAKVTVACADDLTVLVRFEAGWCLLANQPLAAVDFVSSGFGLTPFRIETSKLFDRFDFLRLVLRSGLRKLLLLVGCCGVNGATGVGTSFIRLISVAEEANDESKEIKSVLVQMMPAFLEGVGACVTLGEMSMLGFSDALLCIDCGIGASVVDMKSLKRLLAVKRCADELVPASFTVSTSHTFSLLVFHNFMRALRACTISSMMSNCRLWTLPRTSVDGGPAPMLSRREPAFDLQESEEW